MLKREMEFGRYNTFRVSGSGAEDHRRAREKELLQKTTWPIASWSPRETRLPGAAQSQSRALRMNCQRHEPIRSFWSLGWNGSRDAFQPRPLRGVRCGSRASQGVARKGAQTVEGPIRVVGDSLGTTDQHGWLSLASRLLGR